jgi:hypothetical protein
MLQAIPLFYEDSPASLPVISAITFLYHLISLLKLLPNLPGIHNVSVQLTVNIVEDLAVKLRLTRYLKIAGGKSIAGISAPFVGWPVKAVLYS